MTGPTVRRPANTPGESQAAPPAKPPTSEERPALSIVQFLTDGSLLGLCEELSKLSGLAVTLRDARGGRVVRGSGTEHWRVEPVVPLAPGARVHNVPLVIDDEPLGALVIEGDLESLPAQTRRSIERVIELLAAVTQEFCRREQEMQHRVREVHALFRLSTLLARATDPDAVLATALDLALDVMELDAGSVVLFENETIDDIEHEEDLVLKASRNLSSDWLDNPKPASKGRLFDRLALQGEVVVSEDLQTDERVLLEKEVREEGLRSFINAGLVFQDRPLGVIRLYSREPRKFSAADRGLIKSIALQAAVAVQQARLMRIEEHDARLRRQLVLAANIQRRMLARGLPNLPKFDIASKYEPSHELGGDFYDLFDVSGNLAIAIGDVVGKGIAAALLMSAVRATLRAHVQDVYHIDEVISRVNKALCRDTLQSEFATVFYGVIDPPTMRLTYCSAGHDPTLVIRATPGRAPTLKDIDELTAGGMAVGIDPAQRYQRGTYDFRPGDTFVAYTDGVTDAFNAQKKRYGKVRLRESLLAALTESPNASAAFVLGRIFSDLRKYAGDIDRNDDQTVVVLRTK